MHLQMIKIKNNLHLEARKAASFLDYVIWLLFDRAKFKKIKTGEIKKILIVLINQEKGNIGGDFVTLGAMNYFKRLHPEIKLIFLSDKKTIAQFGEVPEIEFVIYSKEKSMEKLKNEKISAVLFLNQAKLKTNEFSFIPYKIGLTHFGISGFFKRRKFGYTRKIYGKTSDHMVDGRFKMLKALGFKIKEKKLMFVYSKDEQRKVSSFLKKNNVAKFIIMHPGGKYVAESYAQGKWPPHLWNLDRYAKVADHFIKKGFKIIITGTKNEEILAGEIKKFSEHKNKIINACGKFSIREAGALLKRSELLIATDTAIVHVAYQHPINAKIVELIGPSIPEVVGAWPLDSPRHRILVDKGPYYRSMRKLPLANNFNCLKNIQVQDVIKAAEDLIKTASSDS